MRKFGLIGFPLTHSFSKKYFTEKFETENITNCKYDLFSIADAREMIELIEREPFLCGLNVTIPHKLNVMSFLNEIDNAATAGYFFRCLNAPRGLARFQSKGRRFSTGKDSGKTK